MHGARSSFVPQGSPDMEVQFVPPKEVLLSQSRTHNTLSRPEQTCPVALAKWEYRMLALAIRGTTMYLNMASSKYEPRFSWEPREVLAPPMELPIRAQSKLGLCQMG